MLKLINQPVDQAAIKWPQLPPFNHAKQGCFYFTHYWPLICGSRSKPRTLQVAAVWSSIVGAPTRNVGRPINPLELWSPILPSSLKLSLKPTSAPFGLASACNNTSCLPLLRQWPKGRLRTTTRQLVVFANSVLASLDPCKVLTFKSYMAEYVVYAHNVCVHVTHIGNGKVVGIVYWSADNGCADICLSWYLS